MKKVLERVRDFFVNFDGGFEFFTITMNIVFKDVTLFNVFYNGKDYPLLAVQYIPATKQIRVRGLFGALEAGE